MKKIFLALALVLTFHVAGAQQAKSIPEAKAAVEKAVEDSQNPKKAEKPATWIKLGQSYIDAYLAPMGNGILGQAEQETAIVMAKEKKPQISEVTVMGKPAKKYKYANVAYYFQNGQLTIIEVTKPAIGGALYKAIDAYKKANELDTKGKSTKQISAALAKIQDYGNNDAYSYYQLGDPAKASKNFELAAKAASTEPLSKIDTSAIYNAGFTAYMAKDLKKAEQMYKKSVKLGYYGDGADAFVKLADIAKQNGDTLSCKKYLEEGFTATQGKSQAVLVGLINYYLESKEDTNQLFVLLDAAKKNEPTNASLYYVEGNIHKQLGHFEEAAAAYDKCSEINPAYEYGYIGKGILFYDKAIEYQQAAATEMDDNKYMELAKKFEESLKGCVEPFEKAYETTKDASVKNSLAEYLKNACFRFRTEPGFSEKYEKYNAIVAAAKQ